MVKRREDESSSVCIEVNLTQDGVAARSLRDSNASSWKGELLSTFLWHVLYMRTQIPIPYVQLSKIGETLSASAAEGEAAGRQKKPSFKKTSIVRKVNKFMNEVEAVLGSAESLCASNVDVACVMLGASARRPREVFYLQFPHIEDSNTSATQQQQQSHQKEETKEQDERDLKRVLNSLKRKMLRELISHWVEPTSGGGEFGGAARPLSIFLALHQQPEPHLQNTATDVKSVSGQNSIFASVNGNSALSFPPLSASAHLGFPGSEHFRIDEKFCPKLRRRAPQPLLLQINEMNDLQDSLLHQKKEKKEMVESVGVKRAKSGPSDSSAGGAQTASLSRFHVCTSVTEAEEDSSAGDGDDDDSGGSDSNSSDSDGGEDSGSEGSVSVEPEGAQVDQGDGRWFLVKKGMKALKVRGGVL